MKKKKKFNKYIFFFYLGNIFYLVKKKI